MLEEDYQRFIDKNEAFPLIFFKNISRYNSTLVRFVEFLVSSSELMKNRVQKVFKKNQDLKKTGTTLQKKIRSELENLCAEMTLQLSIISKKIELASHNAKETVSLLIRDSVQDKVIGESSIFDLSLAFPNLKREDVLARYSDEIAINYKYLYTLILEYLKDAQRVLKFK